MIDIKSADLHTPLFLAGTNFGLKLDPKMKTNGVLKLQYDRAEKELFVTWNGAQCIVPVSNVASMSLHTEAPKVAAVAAPDPDLARAPRTAQVDSPQSHVFAGPGAGSTGQEKKHKVVL